MPPKTQNRGPVRRGDPFETDESFRYDGGQNNNRSRQELIIRGIRNGTKAVLRPDQRAGRRSTSPGRRLTSGSDTAPINGPKLAKVRDPP